jgi:hypothetical protein
MRVSGFMLARNDVVMAAFFISLLCNVAAAFWRKRRASSGSSQSSLSYLANALRIRPPQKLKASLLP